jgi:translocation and assembly module TamB
MAVLTDSPGEPDPEPAATAVSPRRWRRALIKYLLILPLALLALLVLLAGMLDTAIGHRLLADSLADVAMSNGLRIEIGRIDGSIYDVATLEDVTLRDARGPFLKVPVATLDWRPLAWFSRGLDIRELTLRRGQLLRWPALRPGDPNAALLPNFDIRIDRLAIERLTLSKSVLGAERRIDFRASANIHRGRAYVHAQGRLGGGDRLVALLDADEAKNRFVVSLDYAAPKAGLLAGLTGADADRQAHISGRGSWTDWRGNLQVRQGSQSLAELALTNRAGRLGLAGQVWTFALPNRDARQLLGNRLTLQADATLAGKVLTGRIHAQGGQLNLAASGGVDLAHSLARRVTVDARLAETDLLGAGSQTQGLHLAAQIDGRFAAMSVPFTLSADRYADANTQLEHITVRGTAQRDGTRWTVPLEFGAARIITGNASINPRLVGAQGRGTLLLAGGRISSSDLAVGVPGIAGRLALQGDLVAGTYVLSGPVQARGLMLPNIGLADADAALMLRLGQAHGWNLGVGLTGGFSRMDNATLVKLVGDRPRFAMVVSAGQGRSLQLDRGNVAGSQLSLQLTGRRLGDGSLALTGSGRQATYGAFTFVTAVGGNGPQGTFRFADPLPAAGLTDVELGLAPIAGGLRIDVKGGSTLGPFAGQLGLFMAQNTPTRIDVKQLTLSNTAITGALVLQAGGVAGKLALAGGGVTGTLQLGPKYGGEAVDLALALSDAHFGGAHPLTIGEGQVAAHGLLVKEHTTLTGAARIAGLGMGRLFIGKLTAQANLTDGRGQVLATLAGRRGSQFDLQLRADVAPGRLAVYAGGAFAGQRIAMPRRAILTAEDGGWRIAATEFDFAGGKAVASGLIGTDTSQLDLALAAMPLSISDVAFADLGLGGTASGVFHYTALRGQMPTGEAQLLLKGLNRSGLLLTSRPIDIALVARLGVHALEARAAASEGGQARGRLQARIADLPGVGTLDSRLRAGSLLGQMRYNGPADALFRLLALDHFDLTGPVELAADFSGNLDNPVLRGSLASDALRLQSSITGMDISQIAARGSFTGSRLTLSAMAGRTANGGQVVGSGTIDFADLHPDHGPGIDLRLGAKNAALMSRPDMALTATGPLRIVSDGTTGTIAGRLRIDTARWQLGQTAVAAELPNIPTREINRSADIAPAGAHAMPWRFLIDAASGGRIQVQGMGIDSNWNANIQLRGTLDAPVMGGRADMIDGTYEFAGRRFDLTRGHLLFTGTSPPDPRLDIVATASVTGLTATVTVAGSSLSPDINFSSVPALPEEDLLSRVLFGDSITAISAPEALQLGAALAALHGGGGLDPINKLRHAIGLDRLRIVSADVTIGRQTGFAAGKYLGRRVYAEIVTDGRGYSATNLEFRVTRWLSLLGSVSTVGRQNINAKISKDY